MGWLVLIAAVPLAQRVPADGIALLVAGGLAYTGGVVFFALDSRVRYAHTAWHFCVALGTSLHYAAVLGYAG
jgi:hemolysin III